MVVIRLARGGARKRPSYKVVVADSRKPRNGRFIEYIGYSKVEPEGKQLRYEVNMDRYSYWCSVGAKPSLAVRKLVRLKSGKGAAATVAMEKPAVAAKAALGTQNEETPSKTEQEHEKESPAASAEKKPVASAVASPPPQPAGGEASASQDSASDTPPTAAAPIDTGGVTASDHDQAAPERNTASDVPVEEASADSTPTTPPTSGAEAEKPS